jgi:hypothetical protein
MHQPSYEKNLAQQAAGEGLGKAVPFLIQKNGVKS